METERSRPSCTNCPHIEVDIAMTKMFGGFKEEFYRAYDEGGSEPRPFLSLGRVSP